MYLKFHNADHADVNLHEGMIVIGSGSDCHVMLRGKNVVARHCRIDIHGEKILLRPLEPDASCVLNGRQIHDDTVLSEGDLLLLGQVGCQVVVNQPIGAQQTSRSVSGRDELSRVPPPVRRAHATRSEHATQIRGALPRLVLRGLSGPMLGRSFPLRDGMTIGRARDCDVFVESQEISRQHARLRLRPESVMVEDLASTNGTFVNDERITTASLEPGDELRLDTIRFVMVAPGSATAQSSSDKPNDSAKGSRWQTVLLVLLLLVLAVWAWWTWL